VGDYNPAQGNVAFNPMAAVQGVNALIEIKVGNKDAYKKIMDGLVSKGALKASGNGGYELTFGSEDGISKSPFGFMASPERILIATNPAFLDSYSKSAGANTLPADVKAAGANKGFMLFADIVETMNSINTFKKQSNPSGMQSIYESTNPVETIATIFKNFSMSIDPYKNGKLNQDIVVNMVDDKQNALSTLLKQIVVYQKQSAAERKRLFESRPPTAYEGTTSPDVIDMAPPPQDIKVEAAR
jgi:hypothetical protein